MKKKSDSRPITFKLSNWWAFGFSVVFIIYGGVNIVLGFLDRSYDQLPQHIIFLLIGFILITFAYAYKNKKTWGWYSQIGINSLIILAALIGYNHLENIVIMVLAAVALYTVFAPDTKQYVFRHR